MTSNDELNNNNNNNLNQSTSSEKSFLEKFFDRELDSTVNDKHSNDSDQTIKNNSSSEKLKVKKNESMEIDEEKDHSENVEEKSQVEEFIDKLFNSKLDTSKSKLSILSKTSGLFAFSKSSKKNNENDEIKDIITKTDNVSSANEKIDYLEKYRFSEDNQASAQMLSNYLRIFNLLNSGLYKIYFDRQNQKHECKCLINGLDCCLLNLYNKIKIKTNDQKVNECCNMCMSSYYDNYSINDNKINRNDWIEFFKINRDSVDFNLVNNLLEINSTITTNELNRQFLVNFNKNINCLCLSNQNKLNCCINVIYEKLKFNDDGKLSDFVLNNSCCKKCGTVEINDNIFTVNDLKASIDTDDEIPLSKSKENKHNNHSHYPKINVIYNQSNLSPRKAIIKNTSTNKTKPSTPRKSVKFLTIEDPKYGFVPVPIPDWQENLRDPLYSNKFINK